VPLGFIFIPSSTTAYAGISPEKNNAVAGLVNFMRNIGSSVGTSLVTTILARRAQFHQGRLVEQATTVNPNFHALLSAMAHQLARAGMSLPDAQKQALARFYVGVRAQAAALAYIDTYWVLAVCAGLMFLLSFVLRKNNPQVGGSVSLH
jgi:DHA2 family multidrug resistance protein